MTIVKKNYYPFALKKYPKFGHFQYESHFCRERAIGTSKPVKVEY